MGRAEENRACTIAPPTQKPHPPAPSPKGEGECWQQFAKE